VKKKQRTKVTQVVSAAARTLRSRLPSAFGPAGSTAREVGGFDGSAPRTASLSPPRQITDHLSSMCCLKGTARAESPHAQRAGSAKALPQAGDKQKVVLVVPDAVRRILLKGSD